MQRQPSCAEKPRPSIPPIGSIALLSATALAFEVLLTRLFSIIQWHHFSHMIISLALLGYGASGAFLTLLGARVHRYFGGLFAANAGVFACSMVAGFLLAQQMPFNALEIGWNYRQLGYLFALYLVLAIPFFCVANCFGLAFMYYGDQIHRIYAVDLLGAGVGAVGVILLLYALAPAQVLLALGAIGLTATGLAVLETRRPLRWLIGVPFAIGVLGVLPASWTMLNLSEYKDLSQALRLIGAEAIAERFSPLGLVNVVRNPRAPFRHAPGLSLTADADPPVQLGLFSDGDAIGGITRFNGERATLRYLDFLTSALPYHLLTKPRVLVLGAGGGGDVLQAIHHRAQRVDAVELNPQIVALVRDEFGAFAGGLYDRPEVTVHIAEARSFVARSAGRYDLIQMAPLDAFGTTAAGLYALNENYLYTVEAFEEYLRHLQPGGMLAVTRWVRLPPRDSLKLFATAVEALRRGGVADPGARLMVIRGWKTSTLLVRHGPFTQAEIAALRTFCRQRSFDPVWYPGMTAAEANIFNLRERAYLHQGAVAILGPEKEDFFERYKFDVTPATDDRPYFFRFFKWRTLPELLSMQARGGLGQLEWGYLILVATLVQALLAGVVLILLPLWLGRTRGGSVTTGDRWRVFGFFSTIGLAFLFLEIAFIQKFILFLGHPLYTLAVVLCAFLVCAGLGSGYSRRLKGRGRALVWAVAGITVIALVYLWVLPALFRWGLSWPVPVKVIVTVALIAPLAFCMGMPFPLGLARVSERTRGLVPWAWAINGCASVVSAVLATLLAVQLGFGVVVLTALGLYLAAAATAPRRPTPTSR